MTTAQLTGCKGTYERLDLAVDALKEDLQIYRIELADGEMDRFDQWIALDGRFTYDSSNNKSFEIATLKGKNTRKHWNVTIIRLDNGKYEPNSYPL